MSQRGLVMTLGLKRSPNGCQINNKPSSLAPVLRRAITYWDRIDSPLSNSIQVVPSGRDWEVLTDEGLGMCSEVVLEGGGMAEVVMAATQWKAFEKHQKEAPGEWTMGQTGMEIFLPPGTSDDADVLEFDLLRCLPIPADEVPLERVLKFKRERRDELQAFRRQIDTIYDGIVSSGSFERAQASGREQMDKVIADLARSMSESFVTRYAAAVKFAYIGVTAALAAIALPISMPAQVVAGGAAAALGLAVTRSKKPIGATSGSPFAYVEYVVDELAARG